MDAVKATIQSSLSQLREKIDDSVTLQKLEDKTNVPKEYFVLGGGFLLSIAFLSGIGTQPLCLVIGFLFPAFKSVRAMETHNSSEVTQWLVYWVVYAFFSVIEIFVDTLVYWIPFYFRFKLGFLMWAMLPQTRGAKYLYDNFLKDFLVKSSSKIDTAVQKAKDLKEKAVENKKDE
ncbi:hypothetical protein ACHAWO_009722 [Cyclotella atomus]|uniref:Receptor expression-enhancing protein n=1 Tax=Cyclotella atomus TaxID=382360 RepID=A0ABD3P5K4_9STRA